MADLEKILGGTINNVGGIDKNYQMTNFSVKNGGAIFERYLDTGSRISENGVVKNHYGSDTGIRVDVMKNINRTY